MLSSKLHTSHQYTTAQRMQSNVDTKRRVNNVLSTFSEETIYRAFIVLCKNASVLSQKLVDICQHSNIFNKMDTIQQKIDTIKNQVKYTEDDLKNLFQIISKQNKIDTIQGASSTIDCSKLSDNIPTNGNHINEIITKAKDKLRDLFPSLRTMKKKEQEANNEIRLFITNLDVNTHVEQNENQFTNYIAFIKNHTELFAVVLPSMLITKKCPAWNEPNKVRKYWKLAQSHENKIINQTVTYYTDFWFKSTEPGKKPKPREFSDKNKAFIKGTLQKNQELNNESKNIPITNNKGKTQKLHIYYLLKVLYNYFGVDNDGENPDKAEIYDLLREYVIMMKNAFKTVNLSCADISYKIEHLKKRERARVTGELGAMTPEQLQIYNIRKTLELDVYTQQTTYSKQGYARDSEQARQIRKIRDDDVELGSDGNGGYTA